MIEPKHISDEEILAWINAGELVVTHLDDRSPVVVFRGIERQPELTKQAGYMRRTQHGGHGSERYTIRFYSRGKERRIVRSKLVYMFVERKVVPPDHFIDHGNNDRFDDSASNLKLLDYVSHQEKHYGVF